MTTGLATLSLGFGLIDPPNLPPCFKVAHLFGFVERLFLKFLGPILTYFGSNRLKLFPVTSRGSLSHSSVPKNINYLLKGFWRIF